MPQKVTHLLDGERWLIALDVAVFVGLVNLLTLDLVLGFVVLLVAPLVRFDDASIILDGIGRLVVLDVAVLIPLINSLLLGH